MTPESEATKACRLHASGLGSRLMRNNSGAVNVDGRFIRFGLGNESARINKEFKSSDLIGVTPVVITPDMVGKTVGVFTAIEVKADGFVPREEYNKNSREYGQNKFINFVKKLGGFAGFAATPADVDRIFSWK